MKRTLCTLLILSLLLCMSVPALATEEAELTPATHTVSTLDELQAVLIYAVSGDTVVLTDGIVLDAVSVSTEEDILLTTADDAPAVSIAMYNGAILDGFSLSNVRVTVSTSETAAVIRNCNFVSIDEQEPYIRISGNPTTPNVAQIENCVFENALSCALSARTNTNVTVSGCTFSANSNGTQGGAIHNNGIMAVSNSVICTNNGMSGGGLYNDGELSLIDCTVNSNQITNERFGTDILSLGKLNISATATAGEGFYNESTGEKITLPVTDCTDTIKLIYLTDTAAAEYFAPAEQTPPDDEPPTDDEPPVIIHRPTIREKDRDTDPVPVPVPTPAVPALVCGEAIIDLSRSVVLQGYGDGQLHLEDSLTRGQMATIIYRLLDEDTIAKFGTSDSVFDDVPADLWCCPYVSTIAKAGIVNGVGNNRFNPNGKLTWAHIVTVMTRFVKPQTYELKNIQYDGWAAEAVQTAAALGWIKDSADFNPNDFITRGEFTDFVNNILALYQTI